MGKGTMYIWAVAGAYLIYLGIQQFAALLRGEASIPWLNGLAGLLFIAVGGAVVLREWRAYRKGGSAKAGDTAEADEEEEAADEEEGAEEE